MENLSISALAAAISALQNRREFYISQFDDALTSEYGDMMYELAKEYEDYINEFNKFHELCLCRKYGINL